MPTNDAFQGVSNCYVFKSRLQEYAQKVGVPTPVYDTIKEGPSHEPYFKSSVIVNDVRYDSLPGFSNRKAAEQSAAEVALRELAKSGDVNQCISQPVHETGLCKNLLQEYAQKMNYAIPLYQCEKEEGRITLFQCTIEIGGIRYIGAAAKTKKEAEIKAARTALLAIQSSASESANKQIEDAQLTVLPCKKRAAEPTIVQDAPAPPKAKKGRFKKKASVKRLPETAWAGKAKTENLAKLVREWDMKREMAAIQCTVTNSQDGANQSGRERAAVESYSTPRVAELTVLAPPNQSTNNETAWAGKAKTENLVKLVREWDKKREMAAIQCTVTNSQDGANQSVRERAAVESYSTPGVAEPTVLAPSDQRTNNETAWAGKAKTENLAKLVREWDKKREMAAIQCTVTNSQDGANQSVRERAAVESYSTPWVAEPTVLAPSNQSTNNETAWAGKAKTENLAKLVREWDKKREMAAIQCTVTNSQDGANQSGRERAVVESWVGEPTVLAPPNQSTNNETQSKDVNEICGVGGMVVQKPINGSSFTLGDISEVESGSSHVATIFNHQLE